MPRRELLTPAERESLLTVPVIEAEQIRHYTLSRSDLAFIRQHRWDYNRLGVAIQLCYLRYPGRVLARGETPPPALLAMVASQLKTTPALWDQYASRDQTRREHQQEVVQRLGLTLFTRTNFRELVTWLIPTALQTIQGIVLVQSAIEEIRVRRLVVPTVRVLELIAAQATTRADRQVFIELTAALTAEHRRRLDALLELRSGSPYSHLAWLRMPPGAPSARAVLTHLSRLQVIRDLELPADLERRVHHNRLLRLAREGAQTAVYQLKEYSQSRRYATLVAIVLEALATLTDETLDLHDRLIGRFFAKSKYKHGQQFVEAAPALQETVQVYVKVGVARRCQRQWHGSIRGHRRRVAVGGIHGARRGGSSAQRNAQIRLSRVGWRILRAAAALRAVAAQGLRLRIGTGRGAAPQRRGHAAHLERDGCPQGTSGRADRLRARQLGAVCPNGGRPRP
jgi:TnpA family transposase